MPVELILEALIVTAAMTVALFMVTRGREWPTSLVTVIVMSVLFGGGGILFAGFAIAAGIGPVAAYSLAGLAALVIPPLYFRLNALRTAIYLGASAAAAIFAPLLVRLTGLSALV